MVGLLHAELCLRLLTMGREEEVNSVLLPATAISDLGLLAK